MYTDESLASARNRWPSRMALIGRDLAIGVAGRPIAPLERGIEVTTAGLALI